MACDLVVASEKAVFGQPEVGLGLIPGFGGTQMLADRVGLSVAMDLIVTGRRISGRDAAGLGLVSRVTARERLDDLNQYPFQYPFGLRINISGVG